MRQQMGMRMKEGKSERKRQRQKQREKERRMNSVVEGKAKIWGGGALTGMLVTGVPSGD